MFILLKTGMRIRPIVCVAINVLFKAHRLK